MLNITRNYADIKFSRRLEYKYETSTGATASSGVKFNQCSSSDDGFNIVYIQGKMDEKNNILFNTASAPIYIGPFCFKSCGLSDSMHNNGNNNNNNDTTTKYSTPATTTTVKTEPIFTKLLRNKDSMVQSKTGLSNKNFKADSITDETSLPTTSSTTLLTTSLASSTQTTTPTTTTQSTSTPTTTSTISSTTSSTTVTTTQTTTISMFIVSFLIIMRGYFVS
jgi:hypothetical protein